jgi:hypothetical protein
MTVSVRTIGRLVAYLGLNPRRLLGPDRANSAAREMQLPRLCVPKTASVQVKLHGDTRG